MPQEILGGLRRRLIKDNFYYMLYNSLSDLGWFTGSMSKQPVTLVPEQIDSRTEIKPNKIGIASEDLDSEEAEMGSDLEQSRWQVYIDIFAEDESIGIHLTGDIYDILRGKFHSLGRKGPILEVYNLMEDGEPYLFTCHIEDIEEARVREWDNPHNKYWWVIAFSIMDTYYGSGE